MLVFIILYHAVLWEDFFDICLSQFHCQQQKHISCLGNVAHNRLCLLNSHCTVLRTPGIWEVLCVMILLNCMSGLIAFPKGWYFSCATVTAPWQKIYFGDSNQPTAPFLRLQLHHKMLKLFGVNVWSKVLAAFFRLMKNPYCPRLLCDPFCPEPCLLFKAQLAGKFSCKLTSKAVERQKTGLFNFAGDLDFGLG